MREYAPLSVYVCEYAPLSVYVCAYAPLICVREYAPLSVCVCEYTPLSLYVYASVCARMHVYVLPLWVLCECVFSHTRKLLMDNDTHDVRFELVLPTEGASSHVLPCTPVPSGR